MPLLIVCQYCYDLSFFTAGNVFQIFECWNFLETRIYIEFFLEFLRQVKHLNESVDRFLFFRFGVGWVQFKPSLRLTIWFGEYLNPVPWGKGMGQLLPFAAGIGPDSGRWRISGIGYRYPNIRPVAIPMSSLHLSAITQPFGQVSRLFLSG